MAEVVDRPAARLRPRDAATLIVIRTGASGPEVLMGERSAAHVFVPNHYVFPGGRVDRADGFVAPARDLRPKVLERLMRSATERRARALGLAALRETFEETGLVLGLPDPAAGKAPPEGWSAFFATGRRPALDGLTYVARAITPKGQPRRFDARFFIADADHLEGEIGGGSGELERQHWVPLAETRKLKIRAITGLVLDEVEARIREDALHDDDRPVPVFRTRAGRRIISHE